ncbi:TonB-dependent siderophore receptor [Pseudomonas yamanorum]|jgi:outer membrane receptor for ferric coprogen and ferric-rhodotorulic acid|uniref:TonB-dependent siderophore receptor n=2 Tax=Pseudomonas TaxID=286 RepID=A0A7Y8JT88_9PSED|nr:TonB-dependent siderophore receptor [Pseudomonas yamanorum]NWE17266.1 TonB-dependent siderophore receptor [Pseudomonas yamanorum]NWE37929.1 TonB-dependent siderophore receptor [Pseudomonas yamanorum]NWE79935.1 TonB-dependent siderophore receptor [Pseudomonas yamanorum]
MRCTLNLKTLPRLSLLIALPFATQAQAQDISFAIPAQPMASALQAFGQQSKLQVLYNPQDLQGLTSNALNQRLSPTNALGVLLSGSGLSFNQQDNAVVLVSKRSNGAGLELGATTISAAGASESSESTHSYTVGKTTTATKLPMSLRETPQSVTVVTRQRMDDQAMKNLDDVMQNATGITIVKNGAERSLYQARGQLVDTLQIDGIPTNVSNAYSMDAISKPTTDIYDRVEIVRGATGLMEGAGNPSAAINLVRKRPTATPQALIETSVGSWDDYKTMVDLSSPLNQEGTLRGRTVLTYNNANSYMDTAKKENQVFYSILEADLAENTMATLGFTYQKDRNSGYDWSGLPTRADGGFYPLSRSTSLTGKWNHLDKRNTTVFADIQHYFDNDWKLVVSANQTWAKSDFLGNFTQRVSGTDDSFRLQPRHFRYDDTQTGVDTYLSGPFQFLGKQHDFVVGSNVRVDDFDYHGGNDTTYNYVFDINNPNAFDPPKPTALNVSKWKYNQTQKQAGVYAASRFSLTDSTKLILGSRASWFKSESLTNVTRPIRGEYTKKGEITPYAGLVQELNENFSAYASYTEIFKPQSNLDASGKTLKPMTGSNYELGLKGEFLDKRLTTAIALFQSDQTGRAEAVSESEAEIICPNGCYRASEKVRNRGIDLEINGALTSDWNVSGGYTYTQSKYISGEQKGDDFSASSPRHLFKIATDYRLPGVLNKTRVGGSIFAQSKMTQTEVGETYKIQQGGYTLTNLHAIYEINKNLEVQYNLDNVFDKKYIQTTGNTNYWNFYGEPRNFNLALRAKF